MTLYLPLAKDGAPTLPENTCTMPRLKSSSVEALPMSPPLPQQSAMTTTVPGTLRSSRSRSRAAITEPSYSSKKLMPWA